MGLRSWFVRRLVKRVSAEVVAISQTEKKCLAFRGSLHDATILLDWVVEDRGWSGSTAERPGLKRILEAARRHAPFDTILVYSYDRFFRNNRKFNRYVDELEDDCGVRLISVTEAEEPELLVDIRSVINEEARRAIIKHTRRAMQQIAMRGYSCGGTPPYGYTRKELPRTSGNRPVVWEINADEARVVRLIFYQYSQGYSYRKIVQSLNDKGIPSPGSATRRKRTDVGWCTITVRQMLMNETYRGWRVYQKTRKAPDNPSHAIKRPREDWIITKNAHPAIINDKLWETVETRQATMRKSYGSKGMNSERGMFPLSGLIKCGQCGSNYTIVHGHQHKKSYYGCAWARDRGPKICTNSVTIEKSRLEAWVYGILKEEVLKPEIYGEVCAAVEEELRAIYIRERKHDVPALERRLEKELRRLDTQIGTLVEALKSMGRSAIPSVGEELKRLETRKAAIIAEAENLKIPPEEPMKVSREVIERHVHELVAVLKRANPLELRGFLREHVSKIVIYPTGRRRLFPTPDGLLHKALQAVRPHCRNRFGAGSGI